MYPETEGFIQQLFARCPAAQPAFLTLTAIHPDGDRPTPSRHVALGDAAGLAREIARLMAANGRGWGAYIGVAPRSGSLGRWSRGGKHDLACLPALFVDIDDPDAALMRLGWFDLPATCILHSGRGYHAYWLLETPTTDFPRADRAIRGLAQHLSGDEALTIAQSMRLPGTRNTKAGRDEALCHLVAMHPDRLYSLDEFEPFMPSPRTRASRFGTSSVGHARALSSPVLDALAGAVVRQLDGHWRSNDYIAARCPLPHEKDRPGMHFSYHAETGWGYCFGKHGKVPPETLCGLLGVAVPDSATSAA